MQDNLKNPKRKLYLSKNKIIVILIVTCCLVLGGLSPAINSSLIKKNAKTSKEDYNKKNYEEYKKKREHYLNERYEKLMDSICYYIKGGKK